MGMVFVVDAAGVDKDFGLYPLPHLLGWSESDTEAVSLTPFN